MDIIFAFQKIMHLFIFFLNGKEGNIMPRLYEIPLYKRGIKYPVSARHPFIKEEYNTPSLRDTPL